MTIVLCQPLIDMVGFVLVVTGMLTAIIVLALRGYR